MNMDAKQFGGELALIVKGAVDPLRLMIEAMGATIADQAATIAAQSKALDDQAAQIAEIAARAPAGVDDILPAITEQVAQHLVAIPVPKDGADGEDGKSVSFSDVIPELTKRVDDFLAAIPVPKDGADGKDGLGLTGAMISREGGLVLTLADGSTKDVGKVVGNDAEPGKPGADGLGFEDMTEELADDGRTIIRRYQRGDQVKEFRHTFAVVLDRGVYKEGSAYAIGDGVTWGGSWWIKQADATSAPGDGQGWRLAVKRGQNGRDAKTETPEPSKPVRLK